MKSLRLFSIEVAGLANGPASMVLLQSIFGLFILLQTSRMLDTLKYLLPPICSNFVLALNSHLIEP